MDTLCPQGRRLEDQLLWFGRTLLCLGWFEGRATGASHKPEFGALIPFLLR
jgi:hypothetical protein